MISEIFFKPIRSAFDVAERAMVKHTPIEKTEEEILDTVQALHRATESIERHVEVIEGLATSVEPLTNSVNQLTATMVDLVALLGPMAAAEHGVRTAEREVHNMGHFLGRHGRGSIEETHPD